MELIYLLFTNTAFFLLGYFLDKSKTKEAVGAIKGKLESILKKPEGRIIYSKEENSLNKLEDESYPHHNDYYDEQ